MVFHVINLPKFTFQYKITTTNSDNFIIIYIWYDMHQ